MSEMKEIVQKADTFDKLEMRVGRVVEIELLPNMRKKAYKMKIDFGKFGTKTSVGRFTHHEAEEIKGKLVVGVLNFGTIKMPFADSEDYIASEVLILGSQFPKADSGEATFITPMADVKIGSKLF